MLDNFFSNIIIQKSVKGGGVAVEEIAKKCVVSISLSSGLTNYGPVLLNQPLAYEGFFLKAVLRLLHAFCREERIFLVVFLIL